MAYLILIVGLIVLLFAGDLLVRGAVTIAERLGIPSLIIGLTIVALGTSAPEMVVSLDAALSGAPGIAVGNVVGSNIANVLLVLGLPSIVLATRCDEPGLRRNTVFLIVATLVFIALAWTAPLGLWQGLVMIALMAAFLVYSGARARHAMNGPEDLEAAPVDTAAAGGSRRFVPLLFLVVGLLGLPLGAHLTVAGAREIALAFGMSDAAIGLTVVALGTSLPELAATMMAALRRETGIAVGNVIGSNIFNLLAILGVTAVVAPIPLAPAVLKVDLWVMLAASLVIVPFVFGRFSIGRIAGLVFVASYVAYVAVVVGQHSEALTSH
ncbi:calcium/sodium antiporter [Microbaculum marinum]|uniref:Calcium/sodium antiporter n=1 Tax=Microbaculum marinum TaxID=1764581 RepID=A0AAW9RXI7_9HYPH